MQKFEYLDRLFFETELDEKEVRQKVALQIANQETSDEAIDLGKKFSEEIEKNSLANLSLQLISEEVGYGVFAKEAILPNVFIGEYLGVIRKNDFRRYTEAQNDYLYEYPIVSEEGLNFVIDATKGNLTRFINHSYTPNLDKKFVLHKGIYHLIFVTNQRIEKGEQLTINYGKNYWYTRQEPVPF